MSCGYYQGSQHVKPRSKSKTMLRLLGKVCGNLELCHLHQGANNSVANQKLIIWENCDVLFRKIGASLFIPVS